MEEMATGYRWADRVKVNSLGEYLDKASTKCFSFHFNVPTWGSISPHLDFILEEIYNIFKVKVTQGKASALFMEQKDLSRTWPQHHCT